MAEKSCCVTATELTSVYSGVSCRTLCNDNLRCGGFAVDMDNRCYMCADGTDYSRAECKADYSVRHKMEHHKPCNSLTECLICGNTTNVRVLEKSRVATSVGVFSERCTHLVPGGEYTLDLVLHAADKIKIVGPGTLIGSITASVPLVVQNVDLNSSIFYTGSNLDVSNVRSGHDVAVVITNTNTKAVIKNVSGLRATAAIGHATGNFIIECPAAQPFFKKFAVVTQQTKLSMPTTILTSNCQDINLGELLNVYGDDYEYEYLHPEHVFGIDHYLDVAVNILLTANLVLLTAAILIYDEFATYLWKHHFSREKVS